MHKPLPETGPSIPMLLESARGDLTAARKHMRARAVLTVNQREQVWMEAAAREVHRMEMQVTDMLDEMEG